MDPKVCHIDGKIQELEFPDLKRNKIENDNFHSNAAGTAYWTKLLKSIEKIKTNAKQY